MLTPEEILKFADGTLIESDARGTVAIWKYHAEERFLALGGKTSYIGWKSKGDEGEPIWAHGMFAWAHPVSDENFPRLSTRAEAWEFKRKYPEAEVIMPAPLSKENYKLRSGVTINLDEYCASCGFLFGLHSDGGVNGDKSADFPKSTANCNAIQHSGIYEEDPDWVKDALKSGTLNSPLVSTVSDWWASL